MKTALSKMTSGKAGGPSTVSVAVLKELREYGIDWLHERYVNMRKLHGWRMSGMVLIHKREMTWSVEGIEE